jgi:hypothetical protein
LSVEEALKPLYHPQNLNPRDLKLRFYDIDGNEIDIQDQNFFIEEDTNIQKKVRSYSVTNEKTSSTIMDEGLWDNHISY